MSLDNKTKQNKPPNLVQQVFHPGLFNTNIQCNKSNTSASDQSQLKPAVDTNNHESTPLKANTMTPRQPTWQRYPSAPNKRPCPSMSPPSPTSAVTTQNKYDSLPVDMVTDSQPSTNTHNKPPPIILYGIDDVNELSMLLESSINQSKFSFKIVNKNQLRISFSSIEDYKNALNILRSKNLIGHTFTPREEKCFRIVIKKLHFTTPHEAICKEIQATGNQVRGEIINARHGPEKKPTSTFFVNLEPHINNQRVKEIKYIFHQAVEIEDPKKAKTVVQCHRCQQYGHSKNNCMRPFRCVKCGDSHKTTLCPKKDRSTPAKCALCSGEHPASYKGCSVYKEIHSRKYGRSAPKKPTLSAEPAPMPAATAATIQPSISYAEKLKSLPTNNSKQDHLFQPTDSTQLASIEKIITQQAEKIDILLQHISTLMSLITTLVSQLSK